MAYFNNLSQYLNRDCAVLHKGIMWTPKLSANLIKRGWQGGEMARFVDDGSGEPVIDIGNGIFSGFMPFGSNESGDQWTAMTGQNVRYGYAVMYFGGNIYYTQVYETQTYKSRHGLSATTYQTYTPNQPLYCSENGRITGEDESNTAVNPGHLFPDGTPIVLPFNSFGICMAVPGGTENGNYIGVASAGI